MTLGSKIQKATHVFFRWLARSPWGNLEAFEVKIGFPTFATITTSACGI
jgi:hypothetical protein